MLSDQFAKWARATFTTRYDEIEELGSLPEGSSILFHIWILPSFDPKTSYFVYNEIGTILLGLSEETQKLFVPPILRVKEIVWDYEPKSDIPLFLKSQREAQLDTKIVEKLIMRGRNVHLPIINIQDMGGLDGSYYGIEIHKLGMGEIKLQWWEDLPPEWAGFFAWFHKLRQSLVDALDAQNPK